MKRNHNLMAVAVLALAAFTFVASSSRTMSQGTPGYSASAPVEDRYSNEVATTHSEMNLEAPFKSMDASLTINREEDRSAPGF